MQKNLVIVESPAKAKTIEKFLGKDFKVLSTPGCAVPFPENLNRDPRKRHGRTGVLQ